MNLVLDNDLIRFTKNGQQFGWWDGVDFHTGNIVVTVNERAQLGSFAFVPRSNGSLSFLKVDGENVEQRRLIAISAQYDGGSVTAGTSLTSLTGLTVTAHYSDNSMDVVDNYQLSGAINVGTNTISVSYSGKTTSFRVVGDPLPKELTSISATYSGGTVPAGTALSSLTGITVTARYDDGSTETVTGYTLSGAINAGSNQITVSYVGMTTTITVVGEATSEQTLTSISATYTGGPVAPGTMPSRLEGIVVTAHYSDGTSETVTDYFRSGTISAGENEITIEYQGYSTTITVLGVQSDGYTFGHATSATVCSWVSGSTYSASVSWSTSAIAENGEVVLGYTNTLTMYKKNSAMGTNDYTKLLGKYVKAYNGGIYYIDPNATHTHSTSTGIISSEYISYSPAYLVSVAQ